MTRHRLSTPFGWALIGCTSIAAWLGGCRASGEQPDTQQKDDLTGATVDGGTAGDEAAAAGEGGSAASDGLPCDVQQLLTRCQACHSSRPSAPMSLVTYADLQAPAKSDPTKKVFELVLERISSKTSPMPPSAPMSAADIAIFAKWANAGAPKTQCDTSIDGGALGDECAVASDCPGVLTCRSGVCEVECVNAKDCDPNWTCEQTRCQPPAASVSPIYNGLTTTAAWSTMKPGNAPTGSYSGTVFDGRYVYFAPDGAGGVVLRYDTTVGFTSARAWSTFDVAGIDVSAKNYRGTAFDGRYVYFVPSSSAARLARYDTQSPYLDASSWTLFDLKTVAPGAVGFTGATFDGRYIYLAPNDSASNPSTLRYDTAGGVTSPSSWSTFQIASINAQAVSFAGTVSDGRYVYYVPFGGAAGPRGVIARYDSEAAFDQASSWTTVNLAALHAGAAGYRTGAFDGRYVYLVPGWTAPTPSWATSTIARYDTQASFGSDASWTFFETAKVNSGAVGFNAATFDGRHLILAPAYNGASYHGLTLSYDTQLDMTLETSWSVFDMTKLGAVVKNVRGAAFDGRYVYYPPASATVARFDSRPFSAGAGVPVAGGSFY